MGENYSNVRIRETGEWKKIAIASVSVLENIDSVIVKWQNWLNLITRIASIPSALIMKLNEDTIKYF